MVRGGNGKTPAISRARFLSMALVFGWLIIAVPLFWANDALGYQAAGERLNAGHALYALSSGDRVVEVSPPYWYHPFLYPPLWGIAWRVLSLPGGLALWMAVVTVAMLWWATQAKPWIVALLSPSFAVLLASGNIAGLFLVAFSIVPRLSSRNAGMLVGAMGAVKLFPAILIVWFVARRDWVAVRWAIGTGLVLTALAFLYDPALTWTYLREVIPSTHAMGIAPGYLLGLPWLSYAILGVGCLVVLWRRSYAAAIFAVVFGSPAVGVAGLAMLGAQPNPGHPRREVTLPRRDEARRPADVVRSAAAVVVDVQR